MQLAITTQRAVIQHIASSQMSNRHIANLYAISATTVGKLRLKFKQSNKTWEELAPLTDHDFKTQLGTLHCYRKLNTFQHPDYSAVHAEMQRRDMTLQLLHHEYLTEMKSEPKSAISYSTFARSYGKWLKKQRVSMRQIHQAGEKMFVDFCGKTMPIMNPQTGEISKAQIFVAVLGYSRYTFVYAVPSQKEDDWLACHIEAFKFFKGVPRQVIPDNLKSAVIHNKKDSILLNRRYMDLAEHYQCVISPARPRRPKDKSLAEVMVQIVQRWVLAALRKHQFFSIEELNRELAKRLDELNNRCTRTFPKSRATLFLEHEKELLIPLPNTAYHLNQWKYNIRVPEDYHIEYEKHFYSVPHHYIGQLVDIRISQSSLEILVSNHRIASHIRRFTHGMTTHEEHRPHNHKIHAQHDPEMLLKWSQNLGEYGQQWVQKNLQYRKDYANGLKAVIRLKAWLQAEQQYDQLELACEFVLRYEIFGFQELMNTFKNTNLLKDPSVVLEDPPIQEHKNLRGAHYYKPEDN